MTSGVPGPRAPREVDRLPRGNPVRSRRTTPLEAVPSPAPTAAPAPEGSATEVREPPNVALTRTPQGWAVVTASGSQPVSCIVEGLTLADLVVEDLGGVPEPDRSARRSARGPVPSTGTADPRDARIAALERTVAQLEHALAARVATERAIGMLAERHGIAPSAAFEALRTAARAHGQPVQELAREVLDGRSDPAGSLAAPPAGDTAARPAHPVAPVPRPPTPSWSPCSPAADGRR